MKGDERTWKGDENKFAGPTAQGVLDLVFATFATLRCFATHRVDVIVLLFFI